MINFIEDIHSLSEFKNNTNAFIAALKKNKRPSILTVNGKAEIAVVDIATFQKMQNELEMQQEANAINRSLQDFDNGDFVTAQEAFAQIERTMERVKRKKEKQQKTKKSRK